MVRMGRAGSNRIHWLTPPTDAYPTTILSVREAADPAAERRIVERMAAETWALWGTHQAQIRARVVEVSLV